MWGSLKTRLKHGRPIQRRPSLSAAAAYLYSQVSSILMIFQAASTRFMNTST